jgi:hypothetical protein
LERSEKIDLGKAARPEQAEPRATGAGQTTLMETLQRFGAKRQD